MLTLWKQIQTFFLKKWARNEKNVANICTLIYLSVKDLARLWTLFSPSRENDNSKFLKSCGARVSFNLPQILITKMYLEYSWQSVILREHSVITKAILSFQYQRFEMKHISSTMYIHKSWPMKWILYSFQ